MKLKLFILWLLSIITIGHYPFHLNAATVTVDVPPLRYTVDTEAMTAEVYGPISSSNTITDLVIPDFIEYNSTKIPVTSIRNNAFSSNKNLKGSLTIGNSVQTIGDYAFRDCSGFTGSLTIPNSVQTIGDAAFEKCSGFTGSLLLSNKLQVISTYSFYFTGFSSLFIPPSVEIIRQMAFSNCKLQELFIPKTVLKIETQAFNLPELRNLYIEDSEVSIEEPPVYSSSFLGGLKKLETLYLGRQLQDWGWGSPFMGLKNLKKLETGKYVSEIHGLEFNKCENLSEIILSDGLKYIGYQAFSEIGKLEVISLPSSLEEMADDVFYKTLLREIYCFAQEPPLLKSHSTFNSETIKTACLYVPSQSVSLYKTDEYWGEFKCINPIKVKPTSISIDPTEANILIGQTFDIDVTITPDEAWDAELTWSSSDGAIASVDENGKIIALSVGEAVITVETENGLSASCEVTVLPILATSITIDGDDIHVLKETETLQLTATVLPDNTTYQNISWESSDDSIASVSDAGLVTAVATGEVDITVYVVYQPEIKATYHLTVEPRILGDANDNGVVNVADVGTISDYIVNKPVYQFCFVNADVITDGRITTADVTATVDIIFNDGPSLMKLARARKIAEINNNELVLDDFNSYTDLTSNVGIGLINPSDFVGLQASVLLPQGMSVRNVRKGESAKNHILNYNVTDTGTLDFILYSLSNDSFGNEGSLLVIEAVCENSCENINVENILASDVAANEYSLSFSGGKNNGFVTSLERIEQNDIRIYATSEGVLILNAMGEKVNIFNLTGEVVSSKVVAANKEFYPLASGIYIVNVKDMTTKLIVK